MTKLKEKSDCRAAKLRGEGEGIFGSVGIGDSEETKGITKVVWEQRSCEVTKGITSCVGAAKLREG